MFTEVIWHCRDILRRLEAQRTVPPEDLDGINQGVSYGEERAWRRRVEDLILTFGEQATWRYRTIQDVQTREIEEDVGDELSRWIRGFQRTLTYLEELQSRWETTEQVEVRAAEEHEQTQKLANELVNELSGDVHDTKYDVALSFAGEDRAIAEELAILLRKGGVRVFYDEYETATLWGKDLYQHLSDVYQRQAKYCVMIVSRHYRDKLWTKHEQRAAQARAFSERREYILPIRLDDTELSGLPPTIGYIDIRRVSVQSIAQLLGDKLREVGC